MATSTDMMKTVTDARAILMAGIERDDAHLAIEGIDLFAYTLHMAVLDQRFSIAANMVIVMSKAFKIDQLVEAFRTAKISEAVFKVCIKAFPPDAYFIEGLDRNKTRIDIDLMLTEALLSHEDITPLRALKMAEDLSERASHQALIKVLQIFFRGLDENLFADSYTTTIFSVINRYGKSYPSGKKMPSSLIDLVIENQHSLIDISQKARGTAITNVIFDIKTLRQLQTRGNHEIVSFMAPKWEFRDSDAKSLLHLEEMGFPIDRDKLLKTLSGWSDNFYFECSALYALQSPEFSLDDLQSCFRDLKGKHEKWFNALEASYRELPKAIRNAHIDEKLRASLIALASMEPLPKGYPDALLKINGLGREEAIEIPALAELLLCSDLGL